MKRIFKYPVQIGEFSLEMPVDHQILTVQVQNGEPQMWALVDDAGMKANARFLVVGTGHAFPDAEDFDYAGTFQVAGGALVFHLFEKIL